MDTCREIRMLCDAVPLACQILTPDGRLIAVNAPWSELTGCPQDNIVDRPFAELLPVSERETLAEFLDECFHARQQAARKFTLARENGSSVTVSVAVRAIDMSETPPLLICILTDLTAHVEAEAALEGKDRHFQAIIDAAEDIVFVMDANRRYVRVNMACARMANLSPAEMVGKSAYDIMDEEQAAALRAIEGEVLTGRVVRAERQLVFAGTEYVMDIILTPLTDETGSVDGICGVVRDVTERRKAEENLRTMMQTSADIVASIPSGLFICRYEPPDDLFLTGSNPEAEALTGISAEKYGGCRVEELMPEARRLGLYAELIRVMETGHPYRNDNFFYKDNRFDVVLRIRAFRMPRNCLGVAFEDVTERTRAYEVLHASEKRYRFLFRNTPVMLHSIDATGKIVNVSDHWLSTLGYAREEVIGRKSTAFLTPESRRYAEETVLPAFFASGVCHNIHYQMVKKSGETIDVLLSATAERSPDGAFERSLAVITDVTSLKRAETDARRFARAVEQSLSTVMIVNPEGRIEYVNRDFTALNHLKASDIVGRHFDVLALNAERREEYHRIWQVANERGAWSGTLQMKRPNGDISWGRGVISAIPDESGRVTGYLVTTDDVTAEIRLQQRLAEADKMSAVGLLAAGVAHEFKNYLCGIIGNATFSLDEPNDPAACREMRRTLGTIVDIAERANHLATSLLTYSKAPTHTRQSHDLGAIITQTLALVETELRKSSIEVITHFGETVAVKVTPGEIQQLLLNLLINARQAISSRGVIMISLTRCGNAVLLSVGDTGGGIPTEIQSRIFDPFFSTKGVWGEGEPGGSGLGLSVCRNIAGDHGGELMADSMAGIGTVFTLTLPIDTPGKTGALTPVATVTPRRVILCSRDTGLIRRYLPETAAQNCRLFWMRSSAGKETACNAANLLIWDDDLGADIPSDRQTIEIPIVVVRRRTDRVRPKSAVAVFEDTPPLSTILGAVASSVSVSR